MPLNGGKYHIVPSIKIVSSVFNGTVNFSESHFQKYIDFTKTKFDGSAIFIGSIFSSGVSFLSSKFERSTWFEGSDFQGNVMFNNAEFRKLTVFNKSIFINDSIFIESRFMYDVTFRESKFLKLADFSGSKFDKKAIFANSKFIGDAKFIVTEFGRFTNFGSCLFKKSLDLTGSFFSTIFLQEAIFDKGSIILMNNSEFSRLEVPWKLIRDNLEYDGSAYLALVKNYNNLERFDDADDCYYQYRIKKSTKLNVANRIFDFFLFYFYGYGIRPFYPLVVMGVLFIVSILIYLLDGEATTLTNAAEISIVALTSQIGSNLTGFSKWWNIAERILGWLLMSSFLVVFAKKTIR